MMSSISPSPAASEQQDLPPPGVGEDLRLRRRLRKIVEKYGVGYFAIRRPWYKTGAKRSHDGQKSMGGAPRGVGAPPGPFWSLLTSWVPTSAQTDRLLKIFTSDFSSN